MRPGVRKLLAVLGVCLVFALGMVAGAAVTIRVVRHRAESALTDRGSDLATERLARRLSDKLRCDAGQREQIAVIFRSAQGEMREVRRDASPRVNDIYRRAATRIREALHADQAETFDAMTAKLAERLHLNDTEPPTGLPAAAAATPPPRDL